MYLLSRTVTAIFVDNDNISLFIDFFSGVIVTLLSISFVFVSERVLEVLRVFFALSQTLIIYILPGVFYLGLYKFREKRWSAVAIVLLVAGIFTGVVELYDRIMRCREAFE